jgi:hypothetical protein
MTECVCCGVGDGDVVEWLKGSAATEPAVITKLSRAQRSRGDPSCKMHNSRLMTASKQASRKNEEQINRRESLGSLIPTATRLGYGND